MDPVLAPPGAALDPPGAILRADGSCAFSVWAPRARSVELQLVEPTTRRIPLAPGPAGHHAAVVADVAPGTLYTFRLDGGDPLPDPASRLQPRGVHGPSAVVDSRFEWTDAAFRPVALRDTIFYELHVGTFTAAGTFEAAIERLDELVDLGVTTVELMPVAQFPGARNWGYDGVFAHAVQSSYGGPRGLQRLVDACHARGLSVALDVVYNHLGPEGNCLGAFAPYFNERYSTPWGPALNFDGPWSDEVRRYFIESALYFVTDHHIDVFRVDAIHSVLDTSARPFLQEYAAAVRRRGEELGRRVAVVAESDLNDSRVLLAAELGGHGMDAQWSDDFHHAIHAVMTGERTGYYEDFGHIDDVARALRDGFVYAGHYSRHRKRRHGNSARWCRGDQLVVALQNHDQVGNRATGDRLTAQLSPAELRLAACALLLSPYVPLLFMGEEYGETAPFQYFTSHSEPELAEAVRAGRRAEFAAFGWSAADVPDPQAEATFARSRVDPRLADRPPHRGLRALYRELIRLRRHHPVLRGGDRDRLEVTVAGERALLVRRWSDRAAVVAALNFGERPAAVAVPAPAATWRLLLSSEDARWSGPAEARARDGGGDGPRAAIEPGEEDRLLRFAAPPTSCVVYAAELGGDGAGSRAS
jgi:maltooligosyltrehalose trehalohydrolase